jgi:hypothetical protein
MRSSSMGTSLCLSLSKLVGKISLEKSRKFTNDVESWLIIEKLPEKGSSSERADSQSHLV